MMRVHQAVMEQYQVALDRKQGGEEKSYTCYLYAQGVDKILKKCGEETFEAVVAAKNDDTLETVGELNDVLYHVTVLLCYLDVPMEAVLKALNVRCATEGKELDQLYQIIANRAQSEEEGSYTAYLFQQGLDKILKKVGEACSLLLIAAKGGDLDKTADETADLLYHLMAMMICKGISLDSLGDELDRRSGKTGNLKQFHQTNVNT
jgi:phosphoribosyl-ATP pyrophosphohydrolase